MMSEEKLHNVTSHKIAGGSTVQQARHEISYQSQLLFEWVKMLCLAFRSRNNGFSFLLCTEGFSAPTFECLDAIYACHTPDQLS